MDTPLDTVGLDDRMAELGIGLLVLHGSRARGEATSRSDVDLAVLSLDGRRLPHRKLAAVHLHLEERAEHPVDLADLATADTLLRMEVVRHGRILYLGDRDLWTDLVARTLIDYDDIAPFLGPCAEGVRRAAIRRAGS